MTAKKGLFHSLRALLALSVFLFVSGQAKPAHAFFCDACVMSSIVDVAIDHNLNSVYTGSILTAMFIDADIALYGDGFTGIDTDMVNGFNTLIQGVNSKSGDTLPTVAQMDGDKEKYYNDIESASKSAPEALVNDLDTHCAITYALQIRNSMEAFSKAIQKASVGILRNRNTNYNGTGNATAGVNAAAELACERAPFAANSTRTSSAVSTTLSSCPSADSGSAFPTTLVDADLDIGSIYTKMQYAVPSNLKVNGDGHVSFQPQSDDEWAYVTAWRVCEHFLVDSAPPTQNPSVGVAGVAASTGNARATMVKMPLIQACMQMIADRTACSQTAASSGNFQVTSGTIQANCFQIQNIACHRLKDSPPSGLGINSVGREDVDYALKNCDTDGLSLTMYDYVWSQRCSDANYMANAVPNHYGKASAVHKAMEECADDQKHFIDKQHLQKQNLYQAIKAYYRFENHTSIASR